MQWLISNNIFRESRTFQLLLLVCLSSRGNGKRASNTAPDLPTGLQLREITFSEEEVFNRLRNLDISKSNGPDGIPARLLKECCQEIAPSLCTLFNLSLQTGRIPSEWKSADVTPVHKKNSKKPAENYRPILLLPIVSEVLERCVFSHFYHHVTRLINPAQHGFFRCSCQFSTPLVKTWITTPKLMSCTWISLKF